MKGIGLCGAHRTGKTTLADALSLRTGFPFVRTSTSEVFRKNGLDPAKPMDFSTRLNIQRLVIEAAEAVWDRVEGPFVTDRTPLDMLAYTLGDIVGVTHVDFSELEDYRNRCFSTTKRFFSYLAVVQPAIPLKFEQGKAALNRAYIEHLNSLIIGLCADEFQTAGWMIIERDTIDIDARVDSVIRHFRIMESGKEDVYYC